MTRCCCSSDGCLAKHPKMRPRLVNPRQMSAKTTTAASTTVFASGFDEHRKDSADAGTQTDQVVGQKANLTVNIFIAIEW